MKDYRLTTRAAVLARYEEDRKEHNWPTGHIDTWTDRDAAARAVGHDPMQGYVRGPFPGDRQGLIAAMHALFMVDQPAEFDWHKKAELMAKKTGQKVFVVMTEARWHLMLFSIKVARDDDGKEDDWYDDHETDGKKRVYANDQYICHYDPDGTFRFDGAS